MSETIERNFTVNSPVRLDLSNIRGSVDIRPAEDGLIHVSATKITASGDASRTEIEFSQDPDGTVRVATRFPDAAWSWLIGSFPCRVEYVIRAPSNCSLKIGCVSADTFIEGFTGEFSFRSVSGGITLRNLNGPVTIHNTSGELELAGLNGELRAHTVSGRIAGNHVNGPVHLDTVSGNVSLKESNLPSVEATTVSGGMVYQTAFGAGPYRFNSVSGDVELVVPSETHCSAELHAVSGKLAAKLPTTAVNVQRGNQSMDVQGGGVRVYLHSVSGNLSLASTTG